VVNPASYSNPHHLDLGLDAKEEEKKIDQLTSSLFYNPTQNYK
jgi:hypothetical protein